MAMIQTRTALAATRAKASVAGRPRMIVRTKVTASTSSASSVGPRTDDELISSPMIAR
jgi:hypothetical protein